MPRKKEEYYIGMVNDNIICISNKESHIRQYFRDNRKINGYVYDIIRRKGNIDEESDLERLVKYENYYITTRELLIIYRDWATFTDNCMEAIDTLKEVQSYTNKKKKSIENVIKLLWDIVEAENEDESDVHHKVFRDFFRKHQLVNMTMSTYLAYRKAIPNYFEENVVSNFMQDMIF